MMDIWDLAIKHGGNKISKMVEIRLLGSFDVVFRNIVNSWTLLLMIR
jgi:hypothetical protein